MKTLTRWRVVLPAVLLGVVPGMMVGTLSGLGTASPAADAAGTVVTVGPLHGFKMVYDKPNPDGSVTAVLSNGREAVVYLGAVGSRLKVAVRSRVAVVKVRGKTKRIVVHGLLVGASNPVAAGGQAKAFGQGGFADTGAVVRDLRGAGLPAGAAGLIAAQDRKLTSIHHVTSSGGAAHISSWCVSTMDLYFQSTGETQPDVIANGCDVRTVLQAQSGNNFISDDESAQASCVDFCSDILQFNIHIDYTFTADNQVDAYEPTNVVSTGCTPKQYSIAWYGLGLSWANTACDGVMTPKGHGGATNVGAYWVSNCSPGACSAGTNNHLAIEYVAKDHATASDNPDTSLDMYVVYDSYGTTASGFTSCANNQCM